MARAQHTPAVPDSRVPDGSRVYAVGDIHGRADLLREIVQRIQMDAEIAPERRGLVFLGDYVDRGPQSKQVLDILIDLALPGFETIFLAGNHEHVMGCIVAGKPGFHDTWLAFGGRETLESYGLSPPPSPDINCLADALPADHIAFLQDLASCHAEGDYLFVHAGIDPTKSLKKQTKDDFMWTREPFLSWPYPLEKRVVHGHSISPAPTLTPARIGIDTGAYATGRLTCLVLEGAHIRFLSTGDN